MRRTEGREEAIENAWGGDETWALAPVTTSGGETTAGGTCADEATGPTAAGVAGWLAQQSSPAARSPGAGAQHPW